MLRRSEVKLHLPAITDHDLQAYREDSKSPEFKLVEKLSTSKLNYNSEDYFETELRHLWKKLQDTRRWIQKAYAELLKLPNTPKTFDEILATIDPERVNKVKEKLKLVRKIQEQRKQLAETEEVCERSSQIRLWAFIPVEQQCIKKLGNLSEIVTERMAIAAWIFKKRLQEFIKEYWFESRRFRLLLRAMAKTISSPSVDSLMFGSIKEIVKLVECTRRIENQHRKHQPVLSRLSRLGMFIGTMRTTAGQNCHQDAAELKSIFDNLSVKIKNRFAELLRLLNESKRNEHSRRLTAIDELHRQKYVEIFTWVDVRTGNILAWINQSKKQTVHVPIICSKLSELLEKQIPEMRELISEQMTGWSSYLSDQKYGFLNRVLNREKSLQECLHTLELKAEEQHRRCLIVLRAQAVRDVVWNFYGLADANKKLSSICLLISLYSDGKRLEEQDEEETAEDIGEGEAKLSSAGSGKLEETEVRLQQHKDTKETTLCAQRKSERVDSLDWGSVSEESEITLVDVPELEISFHGSDVLSLDMTELGAPLPDVQTPSPVCSASFWGGSMDLGLHSPSVSVDPSTVIVKFGSDEELDLTPSIMDVDEELSRLRRRVFELQCVERQLNEERDRNDWFRRENHELMQTNMRLLEENKRLKAQKSTTLYSMKRTRNFGRINCILTLRGLRER